MVDLVAIDRLDKTLPSPPPVFCKLLTSTTAIGESAEDAVAGYQKLEPTRVRALFCRDPRCHADERVPALSVGSPFLGSGSVQ
jgi:hypothetical protein